MKIFSIVAFTATIGIASGQSVAPSTPLPLITNGPVEVTSNDFEAFLLKAPEYAWPEIRASNELIGKATDSVYENRLLAREAVRLGYDKDWRVELRRKQADEGLLATLWADRFRKSYKVPDLSLRAEEIYRLNRDKKYTHPERVTGTYLLVSMQGRTREQAREIAEGLYKRAAAGEDFPKLTAEKTEDPNFRRNKGRFEQTARTELEAPIGDALFALKPGEVSRPIETPYGYHLVQLEKKEPTRVLSFEDVKEGILEEEADRVRNQALDLEVAKLKKTPNTVVHTKNIESLRVDLDRSALDRLHREKLRSVPVGQNPAK